MLKFWFKKRQIRPIVFCGTRSSVIHTNFIQSSVACDNPESFSFSVVVFHKDLFCDTKENGSIAIGYSLIDLCP